MTFVVSKQSRAKKPKGMSQSTVLTNNFSRINANAEQSLEVWNKTRKIINEMDSELGIEDSTKVTTIKPITIKSNPNESE